MSLLKRIFEWAQREGGDLLDQTVRASGGQTKDEGERDDRDGLTDNDSGKRIARLEQEKDAARDEEARMLKGKAEKADRAHKAEQEQNRKEDAWGKEFVARKLFNGNKAVVRAAKANREAAVESRAAKGRALDRQHVAAVHADKDRAASSYFENKARIEREGPKDRPRQPGHDRER